MSLEEKIIALAEPLVAAEGYQLFDLEMTGGGKHRLLRLFIDKDEGVSLDDCASISRQLSLLLDAEDVVSGAYILEVSSPGLTRALKKPKHWIGAIGKSVTLLLRRPVEGHQKYEGTIIAADTQCVTLEQAGETLCIAIANVKKANLIIEGF